MTTIRVSVRDFKARLSRYLSEARHTTVEVTSHRRVVARVTGASEEDTTGVRGLIASGALAWNGGKPKGARVKLSGKGRDVSKILVDDRG